MLSLQTTRIQGCPQGGGGNANRNELSRGRSLLPGHGTFSTEEVGGWRLVAVGSGWRVAVGGWWCLGAILKGCPKQKKKKLAS